MSFSLREPRRSWMYWEPEVELYKESTDNTLATLPNNGNCVNVSMLPVGSVVEYQTAAEDCLSLRIVDVDSEEPELAIYSEVAAGGSQFVIPRGFLVGSITIDSLSQTEVVLPNLLSIGYKIMIRDLTNPSAINVLPAPINFSNILFTKR